MEEENKTTNPESADTAKKRTRKPKELAEVTPAAEVLTPNEEHGAAEMPEDCAGKPACAEIETTDLGKFKSVHALLCAYKTLEAEFTRRSQRLKALEESAQDGKAETVSPASKAEEGARVPRDEELYREVTENEGVRARVLGDYLKSLHGVPLMTGGGAGVKAPAQKPRSIKEAGSLALGYLRNQKN